MAKKYGQHFLSSPTILEKIAVAANPLDEPVDLIVEIGPGRGALTEHLLKRANRIIAIEIDPIMVHYLKQRYREEPRLTVLNQDVLKTDLGGFGPSIIVGNLPYYITSPILDRVFASGDCWMRAVFLVQKEVAERVAAKPGSRDYGYLSVQTQLFSKPEILFPVSAAAFRPPPKVESAVFQLTPVAPVVSEVKSFLDFASVCFRHKRKTLRNNLLVRYQKEAIDALPEAGSRAEQLSIEQMAAIWRALSSHTRETEPSSNVDGSFALSNREIAAGHGDEE